MNKYDFRDALSKLDEVQEMTHEMTAKQKDLILSKLKNMVRHMEYYISKCETCPQHRLEYMNGQVFCPHCGEEEK